MLGRTPVPPSALGSGGGTQSCEGDLQRGVWFGVSLGVPLTAEKRMLRQLEGRG